jgi:hypothetical protein
VRVCRQDGAKSPPVHRCVSCDGDQESWPGIYAGIPNMDTITALDIDNVGRSSRGIAGGGSRDASILAQLTAFRNQGQGLFRFQRPGHRSPSPPTARPLRYACLPRRREGRRVEALVGQCRQAVTPVSSRTPTSRSRFAVTPVSSRTPTSRSRFAIADPPGRVRESHRGAVRAANSTRAGRRSHSRIRGRPHARP